MEHEIKEQIQADVKEIEPIYPDELRGYLERIDEQFELLEVKIDQVATIVNDGAPDDGRLAAVSDSIKSILRSHEVIEDKLETIQAAVPESPHNQTHYNNGNDPVRVELLPTLELDKETVLSPNGDGGVSFTPIDELKGDEGKQGEKGQRGQRGKAGQGYPGEPGINVGHYVISISSTDSPYTASHEDVILCDASGGAITVIPRVLDPYKAYHIKKTDSSTNTVTVNGIIDGDVTFDLLSEDEVIEIVHYSGQWYII